MKEKPLNLLLNSESAFYIDWKGVVLGLLITTVISWVVWNSVFAGASSPSIRFQSL